MKTLRPLLLAALIAAAFYFYTTVRSGTYNPAHWLGNNGRVELTEAAGPEQLDREEQININVYKKAIPSVVNITSTTVAFNFFYGVVPQEGQGSGFVLDKEGHILTNRHVVEGARQVEVTLHNRKKYPARIIFTDPGHDLAMIQITAPDLVPATLGDSRNLQVGLRVFAIGNPFGFQGTMTRGIISSLRSVETPEGAYIDEAIQTDAAINPGNSGGPLLDSAGNVIGINTMIAGAAGQSAGIGFAIPVNTAKALLGDFAKYGEIRRPALGIQSLPIGPDLAEQMGLPADYGVLIISVAPGGPADRAGLRGGTRDAYLGNIPIKLGGDLIVAVDGKPVEDQRDLAQIMNAHNVGDTVTVTAYRGKRKMDFPVTLGAAAAPR
jgi:S1-C subfamily serine protease